MVSVVCLNEKHNFLPAFRLHLRNLKEFFQNQSLGIVVPEFKKVLNLCVSDEIIQQFTPTQANEKTPLVVKIKSFSYRKEVPVMIAGMVVDLFLIAVVF